MLINFQVFFRVCLKRLEWCLEFFGDDTILSKMFFDFMCILLVVSLLNYIDKMFISIYLHYVPLLCPQGASCYQHPNTISKSLGVPQARGRSTTAGIPSETWGNRNNPCEALLHNQRDSLSNPTNIDSQDWTGALIIVVQWSVGCKLAWKLVKSIVGYKMLMSKVDVPPVYPPQNWLHHMSAVLIAGCNFQVTGFLLHPHSLGTLPESQESLKGEKICTIKKGQGQRKVIPSINSH